MTDEGAGLDYQVRVQGWTSTGLTSRWHVRVQTVVKAGLLSIRSVSLKLVWHLPVPPSPAQHRHHSAPLPESCMMWTLHRYGRDGCGHSTGMGGGGGGDGCGHSTGMGGMDVDMGGMDVDMGGMDVDMGGMDVDMGGMDVDMGGMDVDMGGMDVDMGGMDVDMGGMDVDMGGMDVDMGGMDVDIGGMDVDMGGMDVDTPQVWDGCIIVLKTVVIPC